MKINNYGNSLIEIIIALAIFAIIAASISSLVMGSFSLMTQSGNYTKAELLAEEGMEAVRAIRSRSWNELSLHQSALQVVDNEWKLAGEGSSEMINDFLRIVSIDEIYRDMSGNIVASTSPEASLDRNTKKVTVDVSWMSIRNNPINVKLSSILSNWNSLDWIQDDWSGGDGQEIWSNEIMYFAQDSNINTASSGQISLLEIATSTYPSEAILESSAFNMGANKQANSIIWGGILDESCDLCAVKLQIKTAPDNSGVPGDWSETWCGPNGSDGDELDYFSSTTSPEMIHADHYNESWIKYRVIITSDTLITPVLESININYKK